MFLVVVLRLRLDAAVGILQGRWSSCRDVRRNILSERDVACVVILPFAFVGSCYGFDATVMSLYVMRNE